jgi:hypothetical protein
VLLRFVSGTAGAKERLRGSKAQSRLFLSGFLTFDPTGKDLQCEVLSRKSESAGINNSNPPKGQHPRFNFACVP